MRTNGIVLLGLALLVWAATRSPARPQPAWARHLQGWQKVFGVLAVLLALVMMLNPEFLALGLLGDASFFDVLVLLLSLQLQTLVVRAWQGVWAVMTGVWWVMRLRLAMSGAVILLALAPLGHLVSAVQKAVQRLSS